MEAVSADGVVLSEPDAYLAAKDETETTDDTEPTEQKAGLTIDHSPLTVGTDGYGREILVASQDANGKPIVWYQVDTRGTKRRYERKSFAIIAEQIE